MERSSKRLSRAYASYVQAGLEPADVLAAMGLDAIGVRDDFDEPAERQRRAGADGWTEYRKAIENGSNPYQRAMS